MNCKKVLVLLFPFAFLSSVYAQVWIRTYGYRGLGIQDMASAITLDPAGNILVTGFVSISHHGDTVRNYCTIKYDPAGNLQWVRFLDYGWALAVATDSNCNVLVTGSKGTVKYTPDGDILWVRTHGYGGWGSDICADQEGNVYVTGFVNDSITPIVQYAITAKYTGAGDVAWVRVDSTGWWTVSIGLDTAGNVYVAGDDSGPTYLVMKYSPDGDLLWRRGANLQGYAYKLAVTPSGDVYVTGSLGCGSTDAIATVKYSTDGEEQWVRVYNGPGNDVGQTLTIDRDGNCYVAGASGVRPGPVPGYDFVIIKYSPAGEELWQRRYTGKGADDFPLAIGVDAEKNVYVGGFSSAPRDTLYWGDDYTLLKYDSLGSLRWEVRECNRGDTTNGWIYSLVIDNQGYIYTTGFICFGSHSNPNEWDSDWYTVKFASTGAGIAETSITNFNQPQVTIFPNPAQRFLSIRAPVSIKSVRLYDIAGKLIRVYNHIDGTNNLPLANIPAGVYLVKIQTETNSTTRKLLVR